LSCGKGFLHLFKHFWIGWQCCSFYKNYRCNLGAGHDGKHWAIFHDGWLYIE